MKLTQTQGKALVQLVAALRRDWQPAGIEAAIRKATADGATGPDVCVAAVRAAANPEARTPGLIPAPGPHWQGTVAASRIPPTPCGIHPDHPALNCPECKNRPLATAEQIAQRRALARELAANPQPEPEENEDA